MRFAIVACTCLLACAAQPVQPEPSSGAQTAAESSSPAVPGARSIEPTPELAQRACAAIEKIYAPEACTVFGPTFSIAQCLRDVDGIRAEATSDAERHQLGRGLQCATEVASCADIAGCAAEFRGAKDGADAGGDSAGK